MDLEGKRLALDMLNITVWLDNENVEATGIIEPNIALMPLGAHEHNTPIPFSFRIYAGKIGR